MVEQTVGCCDSCGTPPIPADDVDLHGWTRLEITGRTRCLACRLALDKINGCATPAPEGGS